MDFATMTPNTSRPLPMVCCTHPMYLANCPIALSGLLARFSSNTKNEFWSSTAKISMGPTADGNSGVETRRSLFRVLAQPFLERIDFNTAVFPWDYNAVMLNHRLTSPSFRYADPLTVATNLRRRDQQYLADPI